MKKLVELGVDGPLDLAVVQPGDLDMLTPIERRKATSQWGKTSSRFR